jgi:hypothetical protein
VADYCIDVRTAAWFDDRRDAQERRVKTVKETALALKWQDKKKRAALFRTIDKEVEDAALHNRVILLSGQYAGEDRHAGCLQCQPG